MPLPNNRFRSAFSWALRAISRGLSISEKEPVAGAWLRLPGQNSIYNLTGRAYRNSLDRAHPLDSKFRGLWHDIQNVLNTVLDRFEARPADSHGLLEELLPKSTPSGRDLWRIKKRVPNNSASYRYFLDRLDRR